MPAHLAFAVAEDAVGIQGQQRAGKCSLARRNLPRAICSCWACCDGVSGQEVVNGQVGGDEGQAIGQFETFLGEGAPLAVGAQTHGRFVDQVQGQTRFDPFGAAAPTRSSSKSQVPKRRCSGNSSQMPT